MDRRSFIRVGIAGLAAGLNSPATALAQETHNRPVQTPHERYAVLPEPIRWVASERLPKVIEVFWYGCSHCYAFEKELMRLRADEPMWHRQIHRIPAMFDMAKLHAAAFFAAQELNLFERFHWDFFHEIHERRRPMNTEEEIARYFSTLGVDRRDLVDALASTAVARKLEWAMAFSKQARVTFVPWIVVNGRFTCSPKSAGGNEALLMLIDELLNV